MCWWNEDLADAVNETRALCDTGRKVKTRDAWNGYKKGRSQDKVKEVAVVPDKTDCRGCKVNE